MATAKELKEKGILEGIGGNLLPGEVPLRIMYAFPEAIEWMKKVLPSLVSDGYIIGDVTPNQQAANQIREFIRGDNYEDWMVPKILHPNEQGVWELRTPDLRFFGWFHQKCIFILSSVATKEDCKKNALYSGFRDECVFRRDKIDLDEPKFINGGLTDVF